VTLLARAIAAHGGAERWAQIGTLHAHLRSGGAAYAMRLRRAPLDLRLRIDTREPRTAIEDYPRPGLRGVFTPERVWIEDASSGSVLDERDDPRHAFRAVSKRAVRWDDLDLLYFAGYASWNYLTAPFLLAWPGVELTERADNRLDVVFPADIPTHSREQLFYFDDDGLLRRLDYTAEVFGRWARAVQTCEGHREFGGIVAPTRIRIVPRGPGDRPLPGPTLIWIELLDLRPAAA
jgi:hypothetical protein